jgi:synaptotagmin-4
VSRPLAPSGFKTFLVFLVVSVVPAVLGLTLAAILAVAACFCARRVRRQNKKSNAEAAAFPFQPAPRPTRAVRSPNGLASHYLKKSPSPTSIKPPPGAQSPTTDPLPPQTTTTKYSAENEITKSIVSGELRSPDLDQVDDGEYGKLGTLVFKLRFLVERSALVVSVVRCRGLPSRGSNGSLVASTDNIGQLQANGKTISATATDPYVKLQLLPDKQHKVKTR